ncbi:MAG: aminodeoxychorismate/anthranilate synthase component II [Saprospiraceae bacterium]|nr:aminodeoxychorismate/anthranilate synthase component II [Candidatus Opimibacter skivensis]
MEIVLIDNYDSFTHNLAQYLKEQDRVCLTILKNDAFELKELDSFDRIVISPGPGLPAVAGKIIPVINHYSGKVPILGICLGLQAIYEAFGGRLFNLPLVQHGVTSTVSILDLDDLIFKGISNPFLAGRYHSWVCDPVYLPDSLIITATDQKGNIMACRHKSHHTYGLQFHPESILTPDGKAIIRNFIEI